MVKAKLYSIIFSFILYMALLRYFLLPKRFNFAHSTRNVLNPAYSTVNFMSDSQLESIFYFSQQIIRTFLVFPRGGMTNMQEGINLSSIILAFFS